MITGPVNCTNWDVKLTAAAREIAGDLTLSELSMVHQEGVRY